MTVHVCRRKQVERKKSLVDEKGSDEIKAHVLFQIDL